MEKVAHKYAVGDKLFVVEHSRGRERVFSEGTVAKVGRKYFAFTMTIRLSHSTFEKTVDAVIGQQKVSQNNTSSMYVYRNREEYELDEEHSSLCKKLQGYFRDNWILTRVLTLEQARQIAAILNLDKDDADDQR